MRIRDFKWSTDVILPAGSLLIAAGAALSGVTRVALLMGGVFIVQALRVVARLESRRVDGSYATIVAGPWLQWSYLTRLAVAGLAGGAIVFTALVLTGVALRLAAVVAGGLTLVCVFIGAWFQRDRQGRP